MLHFYIGLNRTPVTLLSCTVTAAELSFGQQVGINTRPESIVLNGQHKVSFSSSPGTRMNTKRRTGGGIERGMPMKPGNGKGSRAAVIIEWE